MPTNLEIATSKFLHPSNSEKFFPRNRDSIQDAGQPFPMVEFLHKELTPEKEEKAEYADDEFTNPLHSIIYKVLNSVKTPYLDRYQYLVELLNAKEVTINEFTSYVRMLRKISPVEPKEQVSENPVTAGESLPEGNKLPSQSVNSYTPTGTAFSASHGNISIGFIRRIASKLSANWGVKGKS